VSSAAVAEASPARRPWRHAVIAIEALAAYLALRLAIVGGPGAFPAAGSARVGPGVPSELKIYPDRGYDGQYVYRLAIDPFTTHATAHGITLDLPAYRQQRIMTALLGHVVSWLPGVSTAVALIIVNAVAVAAAIVAGVQLAQDLGRRAAWGWVLGLPACLPASLAADLTEPVAWAGVLVGILAARRRRWAWAAVAFTVAVLARETSAVVIAGFAIESVVLFVRTGFREQRARWWLAAPIAIATAWQLWLWHVWGTFAALSGLRNTAAGNVPGAAAAGNSRLPVLGIVETFFAPGRVGRATDAVQATSNVCERFVLAALIVAAGVALFRRLARPGMAITISWTLAAVLALSIGEWRTDIQFLRAALEAWGLSTFVLLQVRTRWAHVVLLGAALATAWVALYFLPRV
jgi:hypothetical protein